MQGFVIIFASAISTAKNAALFRETKAVFLRESSFYFREVQTAISITNFNVCLECNRLGF